MSLSEIWGGEKNTKKCTAIDDDEKSSFRCCRKKFDPFGRNTFSVRIFYVNLGKLKWFFSGTDYLDVCDLNLWEQPDFVPEDLLF